MNRRTLLLVVILGLVTVGFVSLAIYNQRRQTVSTGQSPRQSIPTTQPINKTSQLFFGAISNATTQNSSTTSAISSTKTVPVSINAGENEVTGVQLELSYDPKVISNVSVLPPETPTESFFGNTTDYIVLFNEVNQEEGRISYAIAITPSSTARTGQGVVANLRFTKTSTTPTTIQFIEKSLVMPQGSTQSVLKETQNITVE